MKIFRANFPFCVDESRSQYSVHYPTLAGARKGAREAVAHEARESPWTLRDLLEDARSGRDGSASGYVVVTLTEVDAGRVTRRTLCLMADGDPWVEADRDLEPLRVFVRLRAPREDDGSMFTDANGEGD